MRILHRSFSFRCALEWTGSGIRSRFAEAQKVPSGWWSWSPCPAPPLLAFVLSAQPCEYRTSRWEACRRCKRGSLQADQGLLPQGQLPPEDIFLLWSPAHHQKRNIMSLEFKVHHSYGQIYVKLVNESQRPSSPWITEHSLPTGWRSVDWCGHLPRELTVPNDQDRLFRVTPVGSSLIRTQPSWTYLASHLTVSLSHSVWEQNRWFTIKSLWLHNSGRRLQKVAA